MTFTDILCDMLSRGVNLVNRTVSDFSDADMLVRPAPAANHAAWQIGHLINSEVNLVNMIIPGAVPAQPDDFRRKFSKETARLDDPAAFPGKAELLERFAQVRKNTVEWVRGLSDADRDRPAPPQIAGFAPTAGHLALVIPEHTAMHVGQIQAIRRVLGKPHLM